jgi:Cdc6-like AAA superfamily ATPase
MNEQDKAVLIARIGDIFSPSAPTDSAALFAGRAEQIKAVLRAIHQKGQHVIIFGERGVGKTSLVNILRERLLDDNYEGVVTSTINCDGDDTFSTLWLKILREFAVARRARPMGFIDNAPPVEVVTLNHFVGNTVTPDEVLQMVNNFVRRAVVILDEVDRITDPKTTRLLADTIKALSDHAMPLKLVLVGVADSVSELVAEHASIERSLVQVRMPRMNRAEVFELIDKGLYQLGMSMEDAAKAHVTQLSQGLPHYTQLLMLCAAQAAVEAGRLNVVMEDVEVAIHEAVKRTQHSILSAYMKAIGGTWRTIYDEVLLACALASTDDLGGFTQESLTEPLSILLNKSMGVKSFARHLNDFCESERGAVLQKTDLGRFRFRNPLMQPFVVIYGLSKGLLDPVTLSRILLPLD